MLYWSGDDPDGEIKGFEYAWTDTSAWTFTTLVMDTFYVPIRVQQDTFTFYIRAVDNYDLKDPTPEHLSFPIRNSPPTITFPVDFVAKYSHTIYRAFSHFTIGWRGGDPDGDSTITRYEWYLADSSFHPGELDTTVWNSLAWNYVDSMTTIKVFDNLAPGCYRYFMRSRDVAGSYSKIISYPDTAIGSRPAGIWEVMPRVGTYINGDSLYVLYVRDNYPFFIQIDSVSGKYALDSFLGINGYSTWDMLDTISYYPQDIEATLKLFDIVVWIGGTNPHFRESAGPLVSFLLAPGRHLFICSQRTVGDTAIYPFLPIDSVTSRTVPRTQRIFKVPTAPAGYPDTISALDPGSWPFQSCYSFAPGAPSGLLPDPAQALYVINSDTVAARFPAYNPGLWTPAKVVFFSMNVFNGNDNNNFANLLRHVVLEEFNDTGL